MKHGFKSLLVAFGVVLTGANAQACGEHADAAQVESCKKGHAMVMTSTGAADPAGVAKATFTVKGMTCSSCQNHIREALMKVEGVKGVSFVKKTATVEYLGAKVGTPALLAAIQSAGYEASESEKTKKN